MKGQARVRIGADTALESRRDKVKLRRASKPGDQFEGKGRNEDGARRRRRAEDHGLGKGPGTGQWS